MMKVKCFVTLHGDHKNSETEEIRLFKVDPSSATVYDDLLAMLINCYKDDTCEFALKWTDEEGDEIVVSSNGELQAALEECTGDPGHSPVTLKMKISVMKKGGRMWKGHCNKSVKKIKGVPGKGGVVVPNWENSNMMHPGITCDGCEGPVMGPRWKCSICPDFDLCKPCKRRGIHKEHVFIKIPYRLRNWRGSGNPMRCAMAPLFAAIAPSQGHEYPLRVPSAFAEPETYIMSDKEVIQLEEQTSDMYISDNLIGAPLPGDTMEVDAGVTETVPNTGSEDVTTVDDGMADGDGDVVTPEDDGATDIGSEDGEFVLLNTTDEAVHREQVAELCGQDVSVHIENIYPEMDEVSPSETKSAFDIPARELPAPLTPTPAPVPVSPTPTPVPVSCTPPPVPESSTPAPAPVIYTPPPRASAPSFAAPDPVARVPGAYDITTLFLPPHVHSALACMLDMGYTNSGEWLAKLLYNKNGDINTVIDILNSRMSGHGVSGSSM